MSPPYIRTARVHSGLEPMVGASFNIAETALNTMAARKGFLIIQCGLYLKIAQVGIGLDQKKVLHIIRIVCSQIRHIIHR